LAKDARFEKPAVKIDAVLRSAEAAKGEG